MSGTSDAAEKISAVIHDMHVTRLSGIILNATSLIGYILSKVQNTSFYLKGTVLLLTSENNLRLIKV